MNMKKPVNILLDTDMGPDCDDAAALAILHALADGGEAEIIGITHCTSNPYGAGCIDAINVYYGRPHIPIGTLEREGFLGDEGTQRYNRAVHEQYPHRFKEREAPDATAVLRRLLSEETDGDVVVVAIGPLPNLANLLRSSADDISPLSGVELVSSKVSQLVVMGGEFPAGLEWNFEMDPASARLVCEQWPTPIMFTGKEIGKPIQTGLPLFDLLPENNPVRQAYSRFLGKRTTRSSWDLTAVLYGVRGLSDYWEAELGGEVEVKENGETLWRSGSTRNCSYLKPKMDLRQLEQQLDELLIQAEPKASREES
jgi:hypothetical protein